MPITLAETLQLVFDLVKRAEDAEKRVQALEAQLADTQHRLDALLSAVKAHQNGDVNVSTSPYSTMG